MRRRIGSPDPFDGNDPAPDVYSVKRRASGAIDVKHYQDLDATKACCAVSVTVTEEDRRRGKEHDDPSGVFTALGRAYQEIEAMHRKREAAA